MTYTEKLNEMREALKAIATQCLRNDDDECAHEVIGACIVISDVINKLETYGLGDDIWLTEGKPGE